MAFDRMVVVGAGAIGASVGALLHEAGHEVQLVARGAHLEAMRNDGLRLRTPTRDRRMRVPVVDAYRPRARDVVLLCVQTQHTTEALEQVPKHVPVVSLQNGVVAPDLCASHATTAVAGMVWVPATRLEAGEVLLHGQPDPGRIDLGAWQGTYGHDVAAQLAVRLRHAGFRSAAHSDIRPWIHGKLLTNLAGIVLALTGELDGSVVAAALTEGRAVLEAAGRTYLDVDELQQRAPLELGRIDGQARPGGSTWQSLARGGSLETHHLNGWIADQGRILEVPTPVNAALTRLADRAEREAWSPAGMTTQELRDALE